MTHVGPGPDLDQANRDARRRGRRKALLHGAFAVVGITAIALLVRSVGPGQLFGILRASARWVPLLLGLEALRIALEVVITASLSADVRRRVPLGELIRIHVVGYATAAVMPAGRAACEAVKAAMLSRWIGLPAATAVGAGNQGMAMLGNALIAVACLAAAAARTGPSALTVALAVTASVTLSLFAVFQLACRRREVGAFLVRRFAKLGPSTAAFQVAIRGMPVVPPIAATASLAARGLQCAEFALLLHGLGARADLASSLVCLGVSIVAGSIGDVIPGQLGATDGAFALAAPTLGVSVADGVAMAVLLHCVQLFWGAFGATVPLWWGREQPAR